MITLSGDRKCVWLFVLQCPCNCPADQGQLHEYRGRMVDAEVCVRLAEDQVREGLAWESAPLEMLYAAEP
ncbi:hypothetical protein GCM10010469_34360 [Streptomyces labedae]|uniref:Uncharacterized protein n=1 Tax=Streptomyces labedae TaxID=285569 RepID=A0ABP6QXM6_9ACTN